MGYGQKKAEDLSELGVWLRYMLGGYKNKEEGEELMAIAYSLKEFAEKFNLAVGDPELKRRYDYYISGVSDENTRLSRAKREGLEQGLKQGKIDTAKKLKKTDLSDALISQVTGLPIEAIKELQNFNLKLQTIVRFQM